MRRTKLVCTIGPACDSEEMLTALVRAGMNVARINFSHRDSGYHRELIRRIKKIREHLETPVAILQDLQGPKIRIGKIETGNVWLERGAPFVLTTSPVSGDARAATVLLDNLHEEVTAGQRILLADGMIELVVEQIDPPDVRCRVVVAGTLTASTLMTSSASYPAM